MSRRSLASVALLVLLGAPCASAQTAAPPPPWPPRKGEAFPALELLDLAGQRVALTSLRGKVLLVEAVGLGNASSQAYAGGNLRGGFAGVTPDMEALSVGEMLQACGVDRASADLLHVKVLLYDLTGARAPTADEARAWVTHFKLDARPGTLLLLGDARYVRPLPVAPAPVPTAGTAKPPTGTGRPRRSATDSRRGSDPVARRSSAPSPLLLVACALVAGSLTGVAGYVASQGPTTEVVHPGLAVAPPSVTLAPGAPSPANFEAAIALTVRSANELAASGDERAALAIIDRFVAGHGDAPRTTSARARLLEQSERSLISAKARLHRKANQGAPVAAEVQRLRQRLPESFGARVDALALELRALSDRTAAAAQAAPSASTREEPAREAEEVRQPEVTADDEAPSPAPTPAPAPEPAPSTPGRADPEPTEPADEDGAFKTEIDTDSPVALALKEMLHAPYVLRDGTVDATYAFVSAAEGADFKTVGFDKAEVNDVMSWSGVGGVDLGVGSQRMARLQHVLALAGDFQVDLTMWMTYSSGRSNLVFTFGKIGVRWGQQIVKLTKSGGGRPLAGNEPDRMIFREVRRVTVRLTRVGDDLSVLCNGREVAEKTLKPGELDGHFGLIATDLRMVITNLRIQGVVDATKL